MSSNEKLHDLRKDDQFSLQSSKSSPSFLNNYFNFDEVDDPETKRYFQDDADILELEEKFTELEKQKPILFIDSEELSDESLSLVEGQNLKPEVDTVDGNFAKNRLEDNREPYYQESNGTFESIYAPTNNAAEQNSLPQRRVGMLDLPNRLAKPRTSQRMSGSPGQSASHAVESQPNAIPRYTAGKMPASELQKNPNPNLGLPTSEIASTSGKRGPELSDSHSADLPEIHENGTKKTDFSVRRKVPKHQERHPLPVAEEDKSLHNHVRRKIFAANMNPFGQYTNPWESRKTARRYSEQDHRRGFEMPGWQRKLSQLFVPPSQEELRDTGDESQKLIHGNVPAAIVAPPRANRNAKKARNQKKKTSRANNPVDNEEGDRLDILDDILVNEGLSDGDSSSDSTDDETHGSTRRRAELAPLMLPQGGARPPTVLTPDSDTICSNRSSSFRRFYPLQAGISSFGDGRSPTEANSIASLVRERNSKNVDPPEEKKKPPFDYGQLALSIVLLTIIVILIALIYHYYHLHILSVFIFDRIKIVEADRIMEVMSVDDATGDRAPLVKIRLGVEFPVATAHTDCTDYLKYLIGVNGEIRKAERSRKKRDVMRQISEQSFRLSTPEKTGSKLREKIGNKNGMQMRKRKDVSSPPDESILKYDQALTLPEETPPTPNVTESTAHKESSEHESQAESPGFWSIFTNIFTPMETRTESSSLVSVPRAVEAEEPLNPSNITRNLNEPFISGSMRNFMLEKTEETLNPSNDSKEGPKRTLNPAPGNEGILVNANSFGYGKYQAIEPPSANSGYISGDPVEESVSVEDFPFGIYATDPFQFEDQFSNMQCVDFKERARLQLTRRPPLDDVDCFSVHWESSSPDLVMKDCFIMDRNTTGVWWGMGDVTGGAMPLSKLDEISNTALYSGEIQQNAVGGLLRRTWISSEGILVSVPFTAKALLSVNSLHSPSREFCLHSETEIDYNYISQRNKLDLDYTLCVGRSVSSLLSKLGDIERMDNIEYATSQWHRSLHPLPEDIELYHIPGKVTNRTLREVTYRFSCPVWRPWIHHDEGDIEQDDVMAYAESIVVNVRNSCGYVLLPHSWQSKFGSLDFDPKRFPNPALLVESLNRKGLVLALTLSSLIDIETPSFKNTSMMDLLIRQVNSTLPILVSTPKTKSAAVLDFTNPNTVNWYSAQLLKLKEKYGIDKYHLTPTSTQSLPPFRRFYSPHPNPDYAVRQFIKAVSRVRAPISTSTAIIPVDAPTFLTASYGDAGWEMLETLPNRMMTISAVGGNLVDGGVVGGWSIQPGHIPDRELYIRWLGVGVFLPAMEISVLPTMYDPTVLFFSNELMNLRDELVIPRLRENLNESLINNYPLVSPLAMIFPKDLKSLPIGDQWFVGKDLMVAPVLKRGARSREIYLPPGIWKDGIYDKLLLGKRYLKNYRVVMGKVPHFLLITPERGAKGQKSRREKLARRQRPQK